MKAILIIAPGFLLCQSHTNTMPTEIRVSLFCPSFDMFIGTFADMFILWVQLKVLSRT